MDESLAVPLGVAGGIEGQLLQSVSRGPTLLVFRHKPPPASAADFTGQNSQPEPENSSATKRLREKQGMEILAGFQP